jgi:hypothetical protein
MNMEIVWSEELTMLTTLKMAAFKDVLVFIDSRYAKNFPDSVAHQEKLVRGRQKLESVIVADKMKSAEIMSSAKVSGSATTQPHTNYLNSGASHQTSKQYGTLSSQKAFLESFKGSSVKKQ